MYNVENFSLWCDFVERDFLDGEFRELLDKKVVNGATSNPSIFKSAFLTSAAYSSDRKKLKDLKAKEIYEKLAIEDIKRATIAMQKLYDNNNNDGFISIEVDPFFCDDAQATIEEGRRLFNEIDKKNVMIKVPATKDGYKAMEALMSEGININATLIFSPYQAKECIEAFKRASTKLDNKNLPKGVISVFVSRFDSKLDSKLKKLNLPIAKTGIYNAIKIYDLIESYGLSHVRTLFASTGVKSDALEKDYYIKELLLKNSVNTAPLGTIKSFISSDNFDEKIATKEYVEFFKKLEKNGIDIENIYQELLDDGLVAFKNAFKEILDEF